MIDKINLYCNINNITHPEQYVAFAEYTGQHSYKYCKAYNTVDFLINGIRALSHGTIDDEQFFMMGDINGETVIKSPRPHLTAVDVILHDIAPDTIYVIDTASQIAYSHHNNRDEALQLLKQHNSTFYVL